VSVYRDGFRVWPYGEPHDDWLRLDQRRVNNPVVRLSNNQIVGFVEITGDGNPDLKDQTNREGLVNNQALEDLRRLIHYVLQFLEAERQTVRHPKVRKPASRGGPDSLVEEVEKIAQAAPCELQARLRRLAVSIRKKLGQQVALQDSLPAGYTSLAALGHAAVGLGRDSNAAVADAAHAIAELRKRIDTDPSASSLLYRAESALKSLRMRHEMLVAMEGTALRRRTIDVVREIGDYRSVMLPLIRERGASFEIATNTAGLVRADMAPEVLRVVLHALLTNSFDWQVHGRLELKATVDADSETCEIFFTDDGPGIPIEAADRVFEPMFSLKEGGRGMGLTVAKELLERHGGRIDLMSDRRRRGAAFRIVLPRKRSRLRS
jgi:signal transduction histidine kinase